MKPSLIIVDDDEPLLGMLRDASGSEGYSCVTFTRAETALSEIESLRFDVLLTDIVLPGMKGLELTSRVKHMRPEMIVIVMSGFTTDFSYDDAIRAGASDFIKKPFTVHEMLMRIRHAKMQERLRALSFTDDLTGLPNRRGFFAFAQQEMKLALRTNQKMVVLFADLDDFKVINDTWGHDAGDEALVRASSIFRETFRDSDIIARMGGDEFAVLLIDAQEKSFIAAKERLQKCIARYNARRDGSFRLSVSVGMAVFDPEQPKTIDELLKTADDQMYEEKQRRKERDPGPHPA